MDRQVLPCTIVGSALDLARWISSETQQEVIVTELVPQRPAFSERTLLLELSHRINNEYTSAINLISVAAVRTDNLEVKTALAHVVDLLQHYADVHRALKMPDRDVVIDAAEYLQTLCRSISRSKLDRVDINLVLVADTVWLDSERCWRLGMIVYELVTNTARHAFFEGGGGEVRVDLSLGDAFVRCEVSDNGVAPEGIELGRGLTILGDLAQSLGGRVNYSFTKGSSFTLVFPFAQHEQQAARPIKRATRSVANWVSP
jgi:two-component sensor histidine kinase